jgi:hypothetical protein
MFEVNTFLYWQVFKVSNLFFCDGPTKETHCKKRILNLDGTDPINYYGSHQHSINKGFFFNLFFAMGQPKKLIVKREF